MTAGTRHSRGSLEKGVADWVIRAQFGHVSPAMMALYSHVRRKALDEAALALEPDLARPSAKPAHATTPGERVTSHVTSNHDPSRSNVIGFARKSGGPSRTRTCDLLVRRLMQVSYLAASSVVCLLGGTWFFLVFGAKLFTDCSLHTYAPLLVARANVTRTIVGIRRKGMDDRRSSGSRNRDSRSKFRPG